MSLTDELTDVRTDRSEFAGPYQKAGVPRVFFQSFAYILNIDKTFPSLSEEQTFDYILIHTELKKIIESIP